MVRQIRSKKRSSSIQQMITRSHPLSRHSQRNSSSSCHHSPHLTHFARDTLKTTTKNHTKATKVLRMAEEIPETGLRK